jgi:hypothetical protein
LIAWVNLPMKTIKIYTMIQFIQDNPLQVAGALFLLCGITILVILRRESFLSPAECADIIHTEIELGRWGGVNEIVRAVKSVRKPERVDIIILYYERHRRYLMDDLKFNFDRAVSKRVRDLIEPSPDLD